MRIIAYTFEADYHCIDCTKEKYHYSTQSWIDWNFKSTHPACDINGIHVNQLDNEGNLVHPVFDTDEWQELDAGFLEENPIQHMVCGDCHKIIDTYEVMVVSND